MKSATITPEKLASISEKLKALPVIEKPKNLSKQEAVAHLKKDIETLQKRNYTLAQIAELLKNDGLDVSISTLKSCLQRSRSVQPKKTQKTQQAAAAAPA